MDKADSEQTQQDLGLEEEQDQHDLDQVLDALDLDQNGLDQNDLDQVLEHLEDQEIQDQHL